MLKCALRGVEWLPNKFEGRAIMKVFVFSYRDFDEAEPFAQVSEELGIELGVSPEKPTMETLHLAEGYDAISIFTTPINEEMMAEISAMGIKMISTRTIGYEHVDLDAAKKYGIRVSNGSYPPDNVADFAIMLMLMATRKVRQMMQRADLHNFSLQGNLGRDFSSFTVGVVGTGRIGATVIEHLSGFGVKILAYDVRQNPTVAQRAQYVSLEEIWKQCDLITFHAPLLESTFHMVNAESLQQMKDGVVLVNTGRGGLIDTEALIEALASGKVGAAGLDTVENEFSMYYYNLENEPFLHQQLATLKSFSNVIVTPHMAFYTENGMRGMVSSSLHSIQLELTGQDNPWRVL